MSEAGRVALVLEYDGSAYAGWQAQKDGPSIQACLEAALSGVADAAVTVTCAGRTDAGVHALAQVAHFDAPVPRPPRAWVLGANSRLPADIAVRWAGPVDAGFHARFSARARSYAYLILNRRQRPALLHDRVWWTPRPLDARRMDQAARALTGEHDFTSFRAAECQARSPVRELRQITVRRFGDLLRVDVTANAFLHHMVRNLVGTLAVVGRGEAGPDWVAEVLAARDRRRAGMTAPACGLYLRDVDYGGRLPGDRPRGGGPPGWPGED